MQELLLVVLRIGFLVLLWAFVLAAVRVVRSDLFGSRAGPATSTAPVRRPAAGGSAASDAQQSRTERRAERRSQARKLVVVDGTLRGTSVSLGDGPVTLGRAHGSTLVLTDDYASNHHARLFPSDGAWLVEDLGSTNGTFLDRTKVSEPTPVPLGVPIRIGKTVMELRR